MKSILSKFKKGQKVKIIKCPSIVDEETGEVVILFEEQLGKIATVNSIRKDINRIALEIPDYFDGVVCRYCYRYCDPEYVEILER